MSLTGTVYCDCVENNRLRIAHPLPDLLFIDDSGCPEIRSGEFIQQVLHDKWEAQNPCSHNGFRLVEHWLGNVALIGYIRDEVQKLSKRTSTAYGILTLKVIYNGTHSGDFLSSEEVLRLEDELESLRKVGTLKDPHVDEFLRKLEDLVEKSLSVGKPIVF